jgi:uncharacterized protein YybS (DUF2232 family)
MRYLVNPEDSVLHVFPWVGLIATLGVTIFAGLGWAGRVKYHRDFPKDSWPSRELARAHTVMYFGTSLCMTFPLTLSGNYVLWFILASLGLLIVIVGLVLLFVYLRKMRKIRKAYAKAAEQTSG